jgi:prepilin-type N-terminal cleavage/methylation domain-containing protein
MNLKKAFTLIELLVVIAIVGILSGFVVVQMNGATRAANDAKVKANLDTIKKATVMLGVSSKGVYPVEIAGCTIGSCTNLDPVIKEYLPNAIPGTYTYQSDGTAFTLSSVLSTGYAY